MAPDTGYILPRMGKTSLSCWPVGANNDNLKTLRLQSIGGLITRPESRQTWY
jgi:hypothetical protein